MALLGKPLQHAIRQMLMIHSAYREIDARRVDQTNRYDHKELPRRIETKLPTEEPHHDVQSVQDKDKKRRSNVRETDFDKKVMQMRLVGLERRDSP